MSPKSDSTGSHPNAPSVDQSDRLVPINLRQSGPTPMQMLISTRVRKSLCIIAFYATPGVDPSASIRYNPPESLG